MAAAATLVNVVASFSAFSESVNKQVKIILHKDKLTVNEDGEKEIISYSLNDVIGVKVSTTPSPGQTRKNRRSFRSRSNSRSNSSSSSSSTTRCVAELCTYGIDHSSAKPVKKLKYFPFLFNSADTFEANLASATECRQTVQKQCMKTARGSEGEDQVPRLLVVINPFSGKKKGEKEYRQSVEPLLEIAGVTVEELLITEQQNHAKEFMQSFDFSRINGIVCVGGDGTLYEILNGIMCRQDWSTVINSVSFGMIPTGSGNAILSSLLHEQGEEYSMLNAINQIIRGATQVMSTALVTMTTQTSYMTNAITWGLIADVDIESEVLRFMGGDLRYTIGALKCIIQKRTYRGRLSYLPVEREGGQALEDGQLQSNGDTQQIIIEDNTRSPDNTEKQQQQEDTQQQAKENQQASNSPTIEDDTTQQHQENVKENQEASNSDKNTQQEEAIEDNNTQEQQENTPENQQEARNSPTIDVTTQQQQEDIPQVAQNEDPGNSPGPIPGLSDPIPSNWITIEADFVSVHVTIVSKLSRTMVGHPNATLGNDQLHIVCIAGDTTRGGLLTAMQATESGGYVNHDGVTTYVAKACRIEPLTDSGRLVVDGEPVEYGPLQIQISDTKMNVFSRKTITAAADS